MKKKKVTFEVSLEDYRKIEKLAQKMGNSKSAIVRMLLAQALEL